MATYVSRDYYLVLGVERAASTEDIKQAYRKLARQHHPDRNPGDPNAEARFKEVSEAYHVLGDGDRRAHYDRFGRAPAGTPAMDFVDMTEMFESLVGDLLSGIGGIGFATARAAATSSSTCTSRSPKPPVAWKSRWS